MTRRFFGIGVLALLTGCAGAGVSTVDLRGKVAAEVAQVVVTRAQLAPWISSSSLDGASLNQSIEAMRARVTESQAGTFSVEELHDLRQFYSSRDGQNVIALAYAAEGDWPKPSLDAQQFARVEQSLSDPIIARSVVLLRGILRDAFASKLTFRQGSLEGYTLYALSY